MMWCSSIWIYVQENRLLPSQYRLGTSAQPGGIHVADILDQTIESPIIPVDHDKATRETPHD